MSVVRQPLLPLYRSLLRETRALPTPYLRLFFRIKFRDDVESVLCKQNHQSKGKRLVKLSRDLTKLRNANAGNHKAFQHVLDLAYGRKGKLWWELMELFIAQPQGISLPPPIIPNVEKSRPPVYSPALTALLFSQYSRSTKPMARQTIRVPPSIANRVGPEARDAQFRGPLSKRREVNARWRYFRGEVRKVIPPLEYEGSSVLSAETTRAAVNVSVETPLQHAGLLKQIHSMAGHVGVGPPKTRRERLSLAPPNFEGARNKETGGLREKEPPLPTRFLRRGHQALLGRIPRLLVKSDKESTKYEVSVSTSAISTRIRNPPHRLAQVDPANAAWLEASIVRSNK